MLALLVPGLIAAVLLGVVGPLIVIEDLRVWPALRRSAQLVRPHFLMTFLLVFVPLRVEESLLELGSRTPARTSTCGCGWSSTSRSPRSWRRSSACWRSRSRTGSSPITRRKAEPGDGPGAQAEPEGSGVEPEPVGPPAGPV